MRRGARGLVLLLKAGAGSSTGEVLGVGNFKTDSSSNARLLA
jgi:hypothetical protein